MKVGVLGAGYISEAHIAALKNIPGAEILICDRKEEKANAYAEKYGITPRTNYSEMLKNDRPDVVSLCVPTPQHAALTCEALQLGIPVLCEKPIAHTVEEGILMDKTAKETGTPLMIAHCLRFDKTAVTLKNIIADKRFGNLLSLHLYRHSTIPTWSAGDWLRQTNKSGGAIIDLHIHDSDLVQYFLGLPDAVTTVGDELHCSTLYHFGSSMDVSAETSWRKVPSFPFSSGIDASFEEATIRLAGSSLNVYRMDGGTENLITKEPLPSYLHSDDFYENEIRYFMGRISGDKEAMEKDVCPVSESVSALHLVHSERESIRTGRTVAL